MDVWMALVAMLTRVASGCVFLGVMASDAFMGAFRGLLRGLEFWLEMGGVEKWRRPAR